MLVVPLVMVKKRHGLNFLDMEGQTREILTRKRFSEKPIVAFTNSTVFILGIYIYD